MKTTENTPVPEYAFTAREIQLVNEGKLFALEQDWLQQSGSIRNIARQPGQVSPEYDDQVDCTDRYCYDVNEFNHAQEPSLMVLSKANDYAIGVRRGVTKMYEEAYRANAFPAGAAEYFAQKNQKKPTTSFRRYIAKVLGF